MAISYLWLNTKYIELYSFRISAFPDDHSVLVDEGPADSWPPKQAYGVRFWGEQNWGYFQIWGLRYKINTILVFLCDNTWVTRQMWGFKNIN